VEAVIEKRRYVGIDLGKRASRGGGPGLSYILESFIPLLRRRGVSEAAVRAFFVDNPARMFINNPSYAGE
jgi:predicted metal-dependent phosphotriesterase family hydrolase